MQMICAYCGKQIQGKYIRDHWGNAYCAVHLKTVPPCDYCGRLIGKTSSQGGKAYQDGRKICGICLPRSVSDPAVARQLLMKVHDQLEGIGIPIKPFKPDFALIDRSRLKQLDRGGMEKQGIATFRKQTRNGVIEQFKMEVFILSGLPECNFISTCAHELMHIWFYSRNITDISPPLCEGSCNMAAYLILKQQQKPEAEYVIKGLFADKSRTYGSGFRKVHKLAEKKGIPGWLEYISTHRRI